VPCLYLTLHDLFRWNLPGTGRAEEGAGPGLPPVEEPDTERASAA
jgi:hypothetical protein